MYIDESGVPSSKDSSKYYILSGIIVHDDTIKSMKRSVFDYKQIHFINNYIDAEIHTHNICKAKEEFSSILIHEKNNLLDHLYNMVSGLSIKIITVVIDKDLLQQKHPNWKIFKTAWNILMKRFDLYLESLNILNEKGRIKIDRVTVEQRQELNKIIKEMRGNKKKWQRIDNIVGDPVFATSHGTEGIQIADAIAYCTTKYLTKNERFNKYWQKIEKLWHTKDGKILGYGLIIFPPENNRKDEGTRP